MFCNLKRLNSILLRRDVTSNKCFSSPSNETEGIKRISKLLIANRGEIACRICRTARRLGVRVVAVYSEADRDAMHVDMADEAYCIGPPASGQSYLRQDKLVAVAKRSRCEAIHPGYGFLSENAEFAEVCGAQGLVFVGPPAAAIRDMGVKSTSKRIMSDAGVPVIPGYHGEDQSDDTLSAQARAIGFPLMIKAVLGGGGKGMRVARSEHEFPEALESARSEAGKAFGDSAVLLERYVARPRHVEVQVFADKHGNAVYLYERDCSVQRRHQKVLEEAPAPGISAELRKQLGEAAVRAAKAVGYVGAGTVEFIMDPVSRSFHFMEMNTRLQVEHPVTEAITGLDLVEWQLKVAAGEKLPLKQEDVPLRGHAFEARIYAEDPRGGFLPGAGRLVHLSTPRPSDTVRVETGVRQNDEVSVHYDPMIAKLVVWGKDRDEALGIMRAKLSEYDVVGVETNVEFIKDLCSHPKFQTGEVHTGFIDEHQADLFPQLQTPKQVLIQASLGLILHEELDSLKASARSQDPGNPFAVETGVRLNHVLERRFHFRVLEKPHSVEVKYSEPEIYHMRVDKIGSWRKVSGGLRKSGNVTELRTEIDDVRTNVRLVKTSDEVHIFTSDRKWKLKIPRAKYLEKLLDNEVAGAGSGAAISPMPGLVDKVLVKPGDAVKKNDPLLVIVAMKMEHIIKASADGTIEAVLCSPGENVPRNKLLVKLVEIEGTK